MAILKMVGIVCVVAVSVAGALFVTGPTSEDAKSLEDLKKIGRTESISKFLSKQDEVEIEADICSGEGISFG